MGDILLKKILEVLKIPEAFANGLGGIGLDPGSLSIKEMVTSKGVC